MSFVERAHHALAVCAAELRREANAIGLVRSVAATSAASTLHREADRLFVAAGCPERTQAAERNARQLSAERSLREGVRPPGSPPLPHNRAKSSGALGIPNRATLPKSGGGR